MISPYFAASFAQIAVVLAIIIKTKDKKIKQLGWPAFISGIFGVTEPAIYGITLPKKKPFIYSCIGAAVGGGIIGFFEVASYNFGAIGIFGLTTYINPATKSFTYVIYASIGAIVAMIISFIITFSLYKDDVVVDNTGDNLNISNKRLIKDITLYSPLKGEAIPLSEVKDEAFSSKALGDGIAIIPTEGKLYSPFNSHVEMTFPTGHAIGLVDENGVEVLIHIGMDTVQLEGKYFNLKTETGKKIKKGDLLIEFNTDSIKEAGYDITTPIVITNTGDYLDIVSIKDSFVNDGEEIIKVIN